MSGAAGFVEVVMMARRGALERACRLLSASGIPSRHSRPRRAEGMLRVTAEDAARARAVLERAFGPEAVVSAAEAAWFRCHACGAMLSVGATHCAGCGAPVGDAHGH